jgi:hypothetical protein
VRKRCIAENGIDNGCYISDGVQDFNVRARAELIGMDPDKLGISEVRANVYYPGIEI